MDEVPPRWFFDGMGNTPYPALPMLGALAVYTLNLVTISAALDRFELTSASWDRLSHLWQS
ncbi:hypothetical protein GCM10020218_050940 [Dactylosporangium vinaceum]